VLVLLVVTAAVAPSLRREPQARAAGYRTLVAWSPDNLPGGVERAVERIDGVRATTVLQGLDWMTRAVDRDGKLLDRTRRGYGIPIEVAVVEPEFRRFVSDDGRALIDRLRGNRVLISGTEERLRGSGRGMRMRMSGRRVRVAGVLGNGDAQAYEVIMERPRPKSWSNAIRFLLIQAPERVTKDRIRRALETVTGKGYRTVIRSESQTPYLRYGDGVRPQQMVKRHFQEFAARRMDGGRIQIAKRWLDRNVRRWPVPILGTVTCHRELFPILRGALREIKRKGLGHLVRPGEYAGCFNSRFIATIPGTRLSRHSWGTALDINASSNCFGCSPKQDARIVRIFRKWGFTWGGTWPIPDGMHFEWFRWP